MGDIKKIISRTFDRRILIKLFSNVFFRKEMIEEVGMIGYNIYERFGGEINDFATGGICYD